MTEGFTAAVARLKQVKRDVPLEEYITVEATVVELFDASHESIRQVGLIRDATEIIKFISWESSDAAIVEEGETYLFEDVSVNEPDSDDDDPEIVFRSKTSVAHQYSDTREQFLKANTPKDQNQSVNYDDHPVTLSGVVGEEESGVQVVEEGLDDAVVPWDTMFVESCAKTLGYGVMTKTRVSEYTASSATLQRKYIIPYDAHKAGVDFITEYRNFVDSEYFHKEYSGMYSSRTLARVGECTMCDATFPVEPHLEYDPVEEADGNYINWWYGGNGTETNEDFARLSCPKCGVEPEWYEEHDYGQGVVRPPSISKEVTFQFTVTFETCNTIEDVVEKISEQVETEFTVRYTTRTILVQKCEELNSQVGDDDFFTIKSSGDPDSRGLTRQYIKCSLQGVLLKDGLERLGNIFALNDEEICRVKEYPSSRDHTSTTAVNSYYYPVENNYC